FNPDWKLTVDGQPSKILRCNFIMRGVYLTAGNHQIVFEFRPSVAPFYLSLAAIGIGLVLVGFLMVSAKRDSKLIEQR
ncbi:MAG: YfhO family protein, partial [Verrucomicrobiota bacterium]|nr:YfhO family protein [Verrucomicrobiota bacterium]